MKLLKLRWGCQEDAPQKRKKRHLTKSRLFVRTLCPFLTKNVTHDPSSKHIVIVILSGMHYTFFPPFHRYSALLHCCGTLFFVKYSSLVPLTADFKTLRAGGRRNHGVGWRRCERVWVCR